jgi:predicted AlkP superfamily pyrophosphatase or phosphodiesterase
LFDVATRAGKRCGAFFNWGPLRDLYDPESVAVSVYVRDAHRPEGDVRVAEAACSALSDLDFAFVYFGYVDECGHEHGWMSDEYIEAVENADRCVAAVLGAASNPTVLLLSDHGGHERTHGTDSPEDMTIPFILSGPGIHENVNISDEVRIFDAPPTLAHLLGITSPREWDGKLVRQALV